MSESAADPKPDKQFARGPFPPGWVKLGNYGTANEAEIAAAALAAQGIDAQVFGANTSAIFWLWQGFNDVDLVVQEADVERSNQVLSHAADDDLEPAEDPDGAPAVDEQGRKLVPVAAFDNVTALRDAQTILASERIAAYAPRLVLRGERPPGAGKRFVLRVAEKDLGAAEKLLAEEAEEDREEPHCPKCGSWRVMSRKSALLGVAGGPEEFECLACHYRGDAGEFSENCD